MSIKSMIWSLFWSVLLLSNRLGKRFANRWPIFRILPFNSVIRGNLLTVTQLNKLARTAVNSGR